MMISSIIEENIESNFNRYEYLFSNPRTLIWLSAFMDYVSVKEVKRSYRGNKIPDADYKKICKSIHQKDNEENRKFIDEADKIAHSIGWIDYETEGDYTHSGDELFRNNMINVSTEGYKKYLSIESEDLRYKSLVKTFCSVFTVKRNELFATAYYGANGFDNFELPRYTKTYIAEHIDYKAARLSIIKILTQLKPDNWYSVDKLIEYMKNHHPYFLIPKNPKKSLGLGKSKNRYVDFFESKGFYSDIKIDEKQPDAFKRVEGRFIERFLETFPYTLGWVELAYEKDYETDIRPAMGRLKAFKLTKQFEMFYVNSVPAPTVQILPNYEITVESLIYPVGILNKLKKLGEFSHDGALSQIKMNKNKIIELSASDPGFDVIGLLKKLNNKPLPQNVEIDLQEWCQQGDAFKLYTNGVLFESKYAHDCLPGHMVEAIDDNICIVQNAEKFASRLDAANELSIVIDHEDDRFKLLPKSYVTKLPKDDQKSTKKSQPKRQVKLKKQITLSYDFADKEAFNTIKEYLISQKVVIGVNESNKTISFEKQYEPEFKKALKTAECYQFAVEEEK